MSEDPKQRKARPYSERIARRKARSGGTSFESLGDRHGPSQNVRLPVPWPLLKDYI